MPKIRIVDNENITLWFDTDHKIVSHQIHKCTFGPTLRNTLDAGIEQLRLNHACKWLSDDRGNDMLPLDDIEWGITIWRNRAVAAGWKFWAIVHPIYGPGKICTERLIVNFAEVGVTAKGFSDPEEALEWLINIDKNHPASNDFSS